MILVYPAQMRRVQLAGKAAGSKTSLFSQGLCMGHQFTVSPDNSGSLPLGAAGEFREAIAQYIDAEIAAGRLECMTQERVRAFARVCGEAQRLVVHLRWQLAGSRMHEQGLADFRLVGYNSVEKRPIDACVRQLPVFDQAHARRRQLQRNHGHLCQGGLCCGAESLEIAHDVFGKFAYFRPLRLARRNARHRKVRNHQFHDPGQGFHLCCMREIAVFSACEGYLPDETKRQ